jgi:hypothetical protein
MIFPLSIIRVKNNPNLRESTSMWRLKMAFSFLCAYWSISKYLSIFLFICRVLQTGNHRTAVHADDVVVRANDDRGQSFYLFIYIAVH